MSGAYAITSRGCVMFHYDRGIVQSDSYATYEQLRRMKGINLVGCWAHARRKYEDGLEENRTLASQAIYYIGKFRSQ